MRNFSKNLIAASVVGATALMSSTAMAGELSGNVGFVSDYFFRGIDQGTGATGSAGLDYDFGNGLAVGTWAADVGDGIEYDLYGSFSGEVSGFSYGIGATGYFYTGDFDDTYTEVNLTGGYGPVSVEYSIGTYDNFTGPEQDYTFAAITGEMNGFYATYGAFGEDADGSYFELGYGAEVAGMDLGVALINSDEDLTGTGDDDASLVFSLGKTF